MITTRRPPCRSSGPRPERARAVRRRVRGIVLWLLVAACSHTDAPAEPAHDPNDVPTPPARSDESSTSVPPPDVDPPGGAIVARGARGVRVAAGMHGAIVAFGWGTLRMPPPFVASECEWREDVALIRGADAAGIERAVEPASCDRDRRVYRSWLFSSGTAAVAVLCAGTGAIHCHVATAPPGSYPDADIPASFGAPSAADFASGTDGEVIGAWVFDRSVVWVHLTPGSDPVVRAVDARLPFSCPRARCAVTVGTDFVNRYAIAVGRPDRALRMLVDRDGRLLYPPERIDSPGARAFVPPGYGIHPDGTFGDGWTPRDGPEAVLWAIDGMGSPVLAAYRHREKIAWIRGGTPTPTLLVGYIYEGQHALAPRALSVAAVHEPGEIAFVDTGSAVVAWTDADPTGPVVRAAYVRAPSGW